MTTETRQRTRSKPTVTASAILTRTKPYSQTINLGSFSTFSESEVMIDLVTPDYFNRKKRGEIVENNMSYTKTSLEGGFGSASYSSLDGVNQYSIDGPVTAFRMSQSGVPDLPGPGTLFLDNLIRDARSACLANMNRATVATGEDLAEANKTIALLKNPVKGISTNLKRIERDYYRRNKGQFKNFAQFLAEYWIEYRFAFSPLVRSMENILIEANKTVPPRYRPFEVSHGRTYGTFRNSRTINAGGSIFNQSVTVNAKIHAYARYRLRGASNFGNGRRWGSRLRDWPDRTWQVMPLSFMVDRVYNVSNIVNGVVNMLDPNVSILATGNTYRVETIHTTTYVGDDNPSYSKSINGETVKKTTFNFSREGWIDQASDVFPSLNFKNLVSNAAYISDLSSLIVSKLTRSRSR